MKYSNISSHDTLKLADMADIIIKKLKENKKNNFNEISNNYDSFKNSINYQNMENRLKTWFIESKNETKYLKKRLNWINLRENTKKNEIVSKNKNSLEINGNNFKISSRRVSSCIMNDVKLHNINSSELMKTSSKYSEHWSRAISKVIDKIRLKKKQKQELNTNFYVNLSGKSCDSSFYDMKNLFKNNSNKNLLTKSSAHTLSTGHELQDLSQFPIISANNCSNAEFINNLNLNLSNENKCRIFSSLKSKIEKLLMKRNKPIIQFYSYSVSFLNYNHPFRKFEEESNKLNKRESDGIIKRSKIVTLFRKIIKNTVSIESIISLRENFIKNNDKQ